MTAPILAVSGPPMGQSATSSRIGSIAVFALGGALLGWLGSRATAPSKESESAAATRDKKITMYGTLFGVAAGLFATVGS